MAFVANIAQWTELAFKQIDMQRRELGRVLPAVIQTIPTKTPLVASVLRKAGYDVQGTVRNFIFVTNLTPADFDTINALRNIQLIALQKILYPLAYGIDEIFKQVAISTDPLLSQLNQVALHRLGVYVKPAQALPAPLSSVGKTASEAIERGENPDETVSQFNILPPLLTKSDWMLVSETRNLIEAPDQNVIEATKVAIIDTGANPPPPFPLNPIVGSPGEDYDTVSLTYEPPSDTMSHGSFCSALAFGRPAQTRYGFYVPVANAKYLHVKIFTAIGPSTSFHVMKAMNLCAEQGAQVVSMSLGGPMQGSIDEDPECLLARDLVQQYGTNFICAAGNDGRAWAINSPAASPDVLCVGAMDWKSEELASYASRGFQSAWYRANPSEYEEDLQREGNNLLKPDVISIGGDVESQIVSAACPWYDGLYDLTPDGMDLMCGSSMAAPHVAGLVALGLEHNRIQHIDDLRNALSRYQTEKDKDWGYGLLKWSSIR